MQIYYGNTQLAGSGIDGPSGLRINGQQVNDEAALFRASAVTYYPRRLKSTRVQFTRRWTFGSLRAAEQHCARHHAELSVQADLLLVAGITGDEQDLVLADAVFVDCTHEQLGTTVVTTYQFAGGLFTTEDVEIPNESELVKAGTETLAASDTSKAIAFSTPFGATPSGLHVTLIAPNGETGFEVWIDDSTISASGFTAIFGTAVPGAGYKLSWIAVL